MNGGRPMTAATMIQRTTHSGTWKNGKDLGGDLDQ
jgi:hypothetical protein